MALFNFQLFLSTQCITLGKCFIVKNAYRRNWLKKIMFGINLANLFNDKIAGYTICSKPQSLPQNNTLELNKYLKTDHFLPYSCQKLLINLSCVNETFNFRLKF